MSRAVARRSSLFRARSTTLSRAQSTTAFAIAAATAAAAAWVMATDDHGDDLATSVARLPWAVVAGLGLLLAIAVVHYACAGLALRGVSNRRLPMRQITSVQLAAAAANRIVPNGVGGVGVNVRYLLRSGLTPGAATSAMAALTLIGGATDAAYAAVVTGVGPHVGLAGAAAELRTLSGAGVRVGGRHSWLLAGAGITLVLVVLWRVRRNLVTSIVQGLRQAAVHLRAIVRRPHNVAVAALSSMATTAVLSAGFVLAVHLWAHSPRPLPAGALMALYLLAAAVGGATPLPAVVGVTEAALVGALVLAGYSAGSATVTVLVFRAITFWLPLPFGLWSMRRLRGAGVL